MTGTAFLRSLARSTQRAREALRGGRCWLWVGLWAVVVLHGPQTVFASCGHYVSVRGAFGHGVAVELVQQHNFSGSLPDAHVAPQRPLTTPLTPCDQGQCESRPGELPFAPTSEPPQVRSSDLLAWLVSGSADCAALESSLRENNSAAPQPGFSSRIDRPPR